MAQTNAVKVMSFMDMVQSSTSVNTWKEKLPLSKTQIAEGMKCVFFYGGPDREGNGYNASLTVGRNANGENITLPTTFQVSFFNANRDFIISTAVRYEENDTRVDSRFEKVISDWLAGEEVEIEIEDENGNPIKKQFKLASPAEVAMYDAADSNGKYTLREKDSKHHHKGEPIYDNFTIGYFAEVDPEQDRPKDHMEDEANIG